MAKRKKGSSKTVESPFGAYEEPVDFPPEIEEAAEEEAKEAAAEEAAPTGELGYEPDLVVDDYNTVFNFIRDPRYECIEVNDLPPQNLGVFLARLAGVIKPGGVCILPNTDEVLRLGPVYFNIVVDHPAAGSGRIVLQR